MGISLSELASNTMLDALSGLLDGGAIELLTDTGALLAVLNLANSATKSAAGGVLIFNPIAEEDAALATGVAQVGRIVTANGSEILSCDCGGADSTAVIRLEPNAHLVRGGPVKINSFRLVMP